MGSGTFYPGAGSDDAAWDVGFDGAGDYLTTVGAKSFIRVVSVTIPKDAIIDTAYVIFTAYDNQAGTTVNLDLFFHTADNPAAPTDVATANTMNDSLTSGINWDNLGAWTDGNAYNSPELKTILQTIVNRAGWAAGQAIIFVTHDDGSTGGTDRRISTYDYLAAAEKAALYAEWHMEYEGTLTEGATTSGVFAVEIDVAPLTEATTIADSLGAVSNVELAENVTADDSLGIEISPAPLAEAATIADETIGEHILNLSITETLSFWGTLGWAWGKEVAESVAIADAITPALGLSIGEWLSLSEALHNNWTGTEAVESTLYIFGQAIVQEIFNETASESVAIVDAVSYIGALIHAIAESLAIVDAVSSNAAFNPVIAETVAVAGAVSLLMNFNNSVSETVDLADAAQPCWDKSIAESLAITDTSAYLWYCMNILTESVAFTETVLQQFQIDDNLAEILTFASTLALQQMLQASVTETLDFGITVELDGEVWECWVLNTNAFHASVYSGYSFNSYAVYNNTAYGCKPDGIYELGGATDNGAEFKSGIVLPETQFGTQHPKRFRKAYFGIAGTSPAIKLTNEDGTSSVYTIADSKVTPTRGVKGRKWTLSVEGFDSLDFVELVPIILTR